jgi:hypothetical protein
MRRSTLVLFLMLVFAVIAVFLFRAKDSLPKQESAARPGVEVSPVCPWRDPQRDLAALFPSATNYLADARVVSRMTAEIVKRLGRQMTPDENPLRIFRAQADGRTVGAVLLTRVRGEHGGVEVVIGVSTNGDIRDVRIQSHREPEAVAREITSDKFLRAFKGKSFSSRLHLADDLPELSAEARPTAQAIADGVRSQLIVRSFADGFNSPTDAHAHH